MAAADVSEELLLEVSPQVVDAQVVERYAGQSAQAFREELDQEGDRDGRVDAVEVAQWEANTGARLADGKPECFDGFEFLRVNDRPPTALREILVVLDQAEGPTTSEVPILESTTFAFEYDAKREATAEFSVRLARWGQFGMAVGCSLETPYALPDFTGGASRFSWTRMAGTAPEQADAGSSPPADGFNFERVAITSDVPKWPLIRPSSIQPAAVRDLWDGRAILADSPSDQQLLWDHDVTFQLDAKVWWTQLQAPVAWVGGSATGLAFLVTMGWLVTEVGRYKLLKALAMFPFFSRFEKDEVLENDRRDRLYHYIRRNPGPSFSDLKRTFDLSNGTLVHHLRILESQEFIKAIRDGFRTRFYIRGPRVTPETYLTRTQQALLEAIGANPGVTQKQLSQILGLPRESVFYHARRLESVGKLRVEREGKWTKYFPTPPPLSLVAKPETSSPSS